MEKLLNKSVLWSVLERYDGDSKYVKFCDSISRFIQNSFNGDDILTIYLHYGLIDKKDLAKIDCTIGDTIDSFLFSI
jgi:hypothetical protein